MDLVSVAVVFVAGLLVVLLLFLHKSWNMVRLEFMKSLIQTRGGGIVGEKIHSVSDLRAPLVNELDGRTDGQTYIEIIPHKPYREPF